MTLNVQDKAQKSQPIYLSLFLSLSLCLVLRIVVRWYHDRSFYGSHVRICTTNLTTEYMSSETSQVIKYVTWKLFCIFESYITLVL